MGPEPDPLLEQRGLVRALPSALGDKIARLVGAGAECSLVATDSTSINLYKVLSAALNIAARRCPAAARRAERAQQLPDRPVHRRVAVPGTRLHGLQLVEARGRSRRP
jgi:kynureninase